jgi:hypothetical protein
LTRSTAPSASAYPRSSYLCCVAAGFQAGH